MPLEVINDYVFPEKIMLRLITKENRLSVYG